MIVLSPHTASTLSPHAADQSWVMFLQVNPPTGGHGPIKIEGVKGSHIAARLRALAADNAFDVFIIGLVSTPTPTELAKAIQDEHDAAHLHHGWYEPTVELLTFVQQTSQGVLQNLLAQARPGGVPDNAVTIDEIAAFLGVSVATIRRMVKADEIPVLRVGKALRFVPADVVATLERSSARSR